MGRLDGRVAAVTGGGRGIGRAIALELAREGATIVVSSRTQSDLDRVLAGAAAIGAKGAAVVADAMDRDQAREPVRTAMAEYGRIDILVNNVGGSVGRQHDAFTGDDNSFEDTLVLNLISAFWTSREALPHMRQQQYGRVINIGSGASKRAASTPAYTSAKHGLIGLTKALAAAAAADGITVNCLCPGWTNTSLTDWDAIARRQNTTPEEARVRAEAESLQHRILEPEELGPMAALLASPDGGGITGQVISVDGGYRV
jgi:NAD(P)-dependent dehydrogenase (short-subunit alcohol dehydrogenase family)